MRPSLRIQLRPELRRFVPSDKVTRQSSGFAGRLSCRCASLARLEPLRVGPSVAASRSSRAARGSARQSRLHSFYTCVGSIWLGEAGDPSPGGSAGTSSPTGSGCRCKRSLSGTIRTAASGLGVCSTATLFHMQIVPGAHNYLYLVAPDIAVILRRNHQYASTSTPYTETQNPQLTTVTPNPPRHAPHPVKL